MSCPGTPSIIFVYAILTDRKALDLALSNLPKDFQTIDTLVNNAGLALVSILHKHAILMIGMS